MSGRRKRTPDEITNAPPEFLLTVRETSILVGMAEPLVREEMSSGRLKSMEIGTGEEMRIPKWCVTEWERDQVMAGEKSINRILAKVH